MFLLYLDESGDPGRHLDLNRNVIPGSSKWFTLAGIIVDRRAKDKIDADIRRLASSFFPQSNAGTIRLHYQPLIQNAPPYDLLSASGRRCLADGVFGIIRSSPCTLLSVTIDLVRHFDNYKRPVNPKAYAMLIMLERFQDFLASEGSQGTVIYERINQRERKRLKGTMRRLKEILAFRHHVELNSIVGDIRNGDPAEEPILQLADFFAYATQIKYRTNHEKKSRWESIKEKYYNLDGGYFDSGNVHR